VIHDIVQGGQVVSGKSTIYCKYSDVIHNNCASTLSLVKMLVQNKPRLVGACILTLDVT
jgi:hypothetical protein